MHITIEYFIDIQDNCHLKQAVDTDRLHFVVQEMVLTCGSPLHEVSLSVQKQSVNGSTLAGDNASS